LFADETSIGSKGDVVLQAVTVYPLSYAHGSDGDGRQDGTTGHASEAILTGSAGEGHSDAARDRIGGHLASAVAVLGIDGEAHWVVC